MDFWLIGDISKRHLREHDFLSTHISRRQKLHNALFSFVLMKTGWTRFRFFGLFQVKITLLRCWSTKHCILNWGQWKTLLKTLKHCAVYQILLLKVDYKVLPIFAEKEIHRWSSQLYMLIRSYFIGVCVISIYSLFRLYLCWTVH